MPPDLKRTGKGSWFSPDDPGEPMIGKARVSVSDEEAKILSALGAGRRVLEIGTGLGVSTRALARFAKYVHTHDIDPWVQANVWPQLHEDLDPFLYTLTTRANCVDNMRGYWDLVFIDADHSTVAVLEDVAFARELDPAVIVLHDVAYENVENAMLALDGDWFKIDTEHGLGIGR